MHMLQNIINSVQIGGLFHKLILWELILLVFKFFSKSKINLLGETYVHVGGREWQWEDHAGETVDRRIESTGGL